MNCNILMLRENTKNICLIFIVFLFFSVLLLISGCSDTTRHPNSDPGIDNQLEMQIRQDIMSIARKSSDQRIPNRQIQNISVNRYLGTYFGHAIVLVDFHDNFPYRVLEFNFSAGDGWTEWRSNMVDLAYIDGELYRVRVAVELGYLPIEIIWHIAYRYQIYL